MALQFERTRARRKDKLAPTGVDLDAMRNGESAFSTVFDRAWAQSIMKEAVSQLDRETADHDETARRRFELLRLRFQEGLPIRKIARIWNVEVRSVHRDYAKARESFKAALFEVVGFYCPGTRSEIEAECRALLGLLE